MVITLEKTPVSKVILDQPETELVEYAPEYESVASKIHTLEDWLETPLENTEWINDKLQEKGEVTVRHGDIQGNIYFHWRNYNFANGLGGKALVEVPCRTTNRGRKPDVAYLTPELLEQFGEPSSLPQSFPLIAEVISPTDSMEDAIAKSQEYLESGCEEVWLVLPEAKWVIMITKENRQIFTSGTIVSTQKVLLGFSISVDELLA
jgi:Uma2 family endonuclease